MKMRIALLASVLLASFSFGADLPEQESLRVMQALIEGDLDGARSEAERLSARHPHFRAAKVLLADLAAIDQGFVPDSLTPPFAGDFGPADWRSEASVRWLHHLDPSRTQRLPAALLHMPASVPIAIVAEMKNARLYVFENADGVPRLIADYYMGIGRAGYLKTVEGDLRTPLGVYRVTRWIDDAELPELYGAGAFPVSYPNGWDRALGRTGHGIWIHGVPRPEHSRPPLSSEGCMTVSNAQLQGLKKWIRVGQTPVVSVESVSWMNLGEWEALRAEVHGELEAWRLAWENDPVTFEGRYAADFRTETLDLEAWLATRRQFAPGEASVSVRIDDLEVFRYDGTTPDLWHIAFRQRFRRDSFSSDVRKEQVWRRADSGWEILYEAIREG